MRMEIAQTIRKLRQERGISQSQLARKLNITPQAVSKWENGLASPDIELLPKLAKALGVSIDDLFETTQKEKVKNIADAVDDCKGMDSKEFLESEEFLRTILLADADNADTLVILGDLYLYYAKLLKEKAVELGKKALQRNADSIAAIHIINNGMDGENYDYKRGHHYWLDSYFTDVLQKQHNENVVPYLLDNLIADEKFEEAIQLLPILKQEKIAHLYEFYMTIIKLAKNPSKTIEKELSRLEIIYANDSETLYKIAYVWAKYNDVENAMRCWKKVFQRVETARFIDPLEQIANCSLIVGQLDRAHEAYLKIIDILHTDWNIESSEEILRIKRYINELEKKKIGVEKI